MTSKQAAEGKRESRPVGATLGSFVARFGALFGLGILVIILAILYLPFLNSIFGVRPLTASVWLEIIPFILLPAVVAFLRAQGPQRQLFPVYSLDDLRGGPRMRGLAVSDILIAHRADRILGVMAVWDQHAYKQDVVESYGPSLARIRPAYDAAARLLGTQPLTPPGEAIPLAFGACISVADDDPQVMRALVRAAIAHAVAAGKAYLMLGFADADPLLAVARRWPHITYRSDVYAFSWSADPAAVLDGRLPYVEVATL